MLAKKGFDPLMGARPMQRLIQDTIRKALADELLFGELTRGGVVTVNVVGKSKKSKKMSGTGQAGEFSFSFEPSGKKQ